MQLISKRSYLYKRIKKDGLNKQDITELMKNQQCLKDLEHRVELYSDFIRGQQSQGQQLELVINGLKSKIYNYNGISPL